MSKTITVYTLDELKTINPEAFAQVLQTWADAVAESGDVPWSDDAMKSLRETVKACGFKITNWQVGPGPGNSLDVAPLDDEGDAPDLDWFIKNVLKPHGYKTKKGVYDFPGNCPFTGYCFDEDCLEHVYRRLVAGDSMKRALESLADLIGDYLQDALEQDQGEESMLSNWESRLFTIGGRMVE